MTALAKITTTMMMIAVLASLDVANAKYTPQATARNACTRVGCEGRFRECKADEAINGPTPGLGCMDQLDLCESAYREANLELMRKRRKKAFENPVEVGMMTVLGLLVVGPCTLLLWPRRG